MQRPVDRPHTRLLNLKNSAYAWRQMLFFASMLPEGGQRSLWASVEAHHAAQDEVFRAVFAPAMAGLRAIVAGETFGPQGRRGEARRFLGWTLGRHWLDA